MTRIFNRKSETRKRQALRRSMPKSEVMLWMYLSRKQMLGFKFRRQHGIGQYVVDFYCPALKLAIEIDGESHDGTRAEMRDCVREKYIGSFGVRFLRFRNEDILFNLDGVLETIADRIKHQYHP